jgi:hypothetical protein
MAATQHKQQAASEQACCGSADGKSRPGAWGRNSKSGSARGGPGNIFGKRAVRTAASGQGTPQASSGAEKMDTGAISGRTLRR